ncbi:hypothetical protein J6590_068084 [Homalodisca vitripennis]|nr:hypothetical protein J6590_068084 [Homalodisca vitripennis]
MSVFHVGLLCEQVTTIAKVYDVGVNIKEQGSKVMRHSTETGCSHWQWQAQFLEWASDTNFQAHNHQRGNCPSLSLNRTVYNRCFMRKLVPTSLNGNHELGGEILSKMAEVDCGYIRQLKVMQRVWWFLMVLFAGRSHKRSFES